MKHYLIERLEATNNDSIIFGDKRSGKTFVAKLEVIRDLEKGKKVFVFDFHNKYRAISNQYEGNILSVTNGKQINLFDFRHSVTNEKEEEHYLFTQHIFRLFDFLIILFNRELTSEERKVLLGTLEEYYFSFQLIHNFKSFIDCLKDKNEELYKELVPFSEEFSDASQKNLFENALTIIEFELSDLDPIIQSAILYSYLLLVNKDNVKHLSYALVVYDDMMPFLENERVFNFLLMHNKNSKEI